jgi:carbamoyl-phosphate synthase large subunit
MLHKLKLRQPPNRTARTGEAALDAAKEIGYPVVVRPSYVLGGRAMEIVHAESDLSRYMKEAVKVSNDFAGADRPLPATTPIEVDVDAVSDGKT